MTRRFPVSGVGPCACAASAASAGAAARAPDVLTNPRLVSRAMSCTSASDDRRRRRRAPAWDEAEPIIDQAKWMRWRVAPGKLDHLSLNQVSQVLHARTECGQSNTALARRSLRLLVRGGASLVLRLAVRRGADGARNRLDERPPALDRARAIREQRPAVVQRGRRFGR